MLTNVGVLDKRRQNLRSSAPGSGVRGGRVYGNDCAVAPWYRGLEEGLGGVEKGEVAAANAATLTGK